MGKDRMTILLHLFLIGCFAIAGFIFIILDRVVYSFLPVMGILHSMASINYIGVIERIDRLEKKLLKPMRLID